MASLALTSDSLGRAVELVVKHYGFPISEKSTKTAELKLSTPNGDCRGLLAICRYVAENSGVAGALGSNQAEQAQVVEWLTWATSELSKLSDDKLMKVNEWLAPRTTLVGSSLSVADLVIYAVMQPAVAALPPAQVNQLCNLLRWLDYLQHTAGKAAGMALVRVPLPPFKAPPPPAVSVAAKGEAKSEASSATKGGKAAAAAAAAGGRSASMPAVAAAAGAEGGKAAKGKGGKEAKGGKGEGKGAGAAAAAGDGGGEKAKKAAEEPRIDMVDIRVGRIVKVDKHPNAEALYLEEIDVGEEKPRQVISGLVKFVPVEKMQDRMVVVCCNLKPAKMRDVMSYGMVLCASNEAHDQVDPIIPPEGVPVGERIIFEGYSNAPLEEVNPKKKILEALFPDLTTDASGTPMYKGVPFMTSKGAVTSTIPNAHVG